MNQTSSSKQEQSWVLREHILEILSAILLALATVASAWSAYQATRWSGVQAVSFSEAATMRAEAIRKTNIATQLIGIDVGLFVQYAAAISQDNQLLADFLFQRFRPELKSATEAWLKTRPLKNPDAPPSPFRMKEYSVKELQEAQDLIAQAEQKFQKARDANQTGDNYILLTVLFALVLFFAGVGTKFELYKLKVIMLMSATGVFIIGLIILSTFPIH